MKYYSPSYRQEMDKKIRNRGICTVSILSPNDDGQVLFYSAKELNTLTVIDEVDPLSRALPTETLSFRVFDYDGRLNPGNLNGFFHWFNRRCKVFVQFGIESDSAVNPVLDPISYYIIEPPSWDNYVATFQAVRTLGLLEKTEFYGSNVRNLYNLAKATLEDAGLDDGTQYGDGYIDQSLKEYTIGEWNQPQPTNHADTLLQIAVAGGCSIRTGPYTAERGDYVLLKDEYLTHDALQDHGFLGVYFRDMFSHPRLERTPAIRNEIFEITNAYFDPSGGRETLATFSDLFDNTDVQTVVLQHEPVLTKSVEAENATILNDVNDSYANCTVIRFRPTQPNVTVTLTVTGFPYSIYLRHRTYTIDATGTEDETVDNPLIGKDYSIATYRGEYLKNRNTYTIDYRGDPCIDALDIIYVQLPYIGARKCLVLRSEITFDGAFHGKLIVKLLENLQTGNPAIAGIAIAGVAVSGVV